MSAPATSVLTGWVVPPSGATLRLEKLAITLDQSWAPGTEAEFVVPYTAALAAQLDPRQQPRPRVRVGLRRAWAGSPTLDDLSDAFTGLTLADLSAEWAGLTLADLSAGWLVDWGSGARPADELVVDLVVRGRRISHGAATITVRAASDELVAQDLRITLALPAGSLVGQIVNVLAAAGLDASRTDLAAGAAFTGMPAKTFDLTTSVWDDLTALAGAVGFRIVCDHTRTWRLVDPNAAPTASVALLRVTGGEDDVDIDGDYADVVTITCKWTNTSGQTVTETRSWPAAPVPGQRIHYELRQITVVGDAWPGPTYDEMAAQLRRLQSANRKLTLTVPADPTARPGMAVTTGAPSLPATTSVATAITFRLPEDTMTIATASTEDI